MKKMNLFLVAILLMSTTPLLAQFGVHVGGAFSSTKFEYDDGENSDEEKFDSKAGFTGGLFFRKQLGGVLALQPEVNWTQRGGKDSESGADVDLVLNFLEVPLYLLYTGGNASGFFAGIGPSFNFGMSGKVKYSFGDEEEEEDINFGSGEDDDLKGTNVAVNVMAGYQLQGGLNINAFLSQSVSNSAPEDTGDSKIKLFTFGLRVGYMFGGGEEARSSKVRVKQVL